MKSLRGKFTVQQNQGGFILPKGAKIEKAGYILKQSSNFLLQREAWKRRFCVLSDGKLFYYQKQPLTSTEKPSGIIFLEHYDVCREATLQEKQKQKGFIFTLQCTDKICLGKDKYMFRVETDKEMSEWLFYLASSSRRVQSRKKTQAPRPLSSASLDLAKRASEPSLFVATKYRAKGPKGRRPPSRKSTMPEEMQQSCRTASLSALHEEDVDGEEQILRASSSVELAYKYSSSNEDTDDEDRIRTVKPLRCKSELDRPMSAVCPIIDDEGKEVESFQDTEPTVSPLERESGHGEEAPESSGKGRNPTLNALLSKMGEITERLAGLQDIILEISGQDSPSSSPQCGSKMAEIKTKLSTVAQAFGDLQLMTTTAAQSISITHL